MERALISRQPIFDGDVHEFGYELLYRSTEDSASISDRGTATADSIPNTFEIGLDELVGRHLAFINFDRNLIAGNQYEPLPMDRVVLEIVEAVEPDEALIQRLRDLKAMGYRIAVGGGEASEQGHSMLENADFVRLNVTGNDWTAIEQSILAVRKYPVKLIAESVETPDQFGHCKALGFDYFQGYFFCKPELAAGKPIPGNRMSTLRMIAALNNPLVTIQEVEEAIGRDVRLSYKLLRYVNSAMCGFRRRVGSIKHGVVLVGLKKIRLWASLLLLTGFDDKARDIVVTAAVRARMCEQLGKTLRLGSPDGLFIVGLFSVLDAVVDQPLDQALASLSLDPAIADAILGQKGEFGAVLKAVLAYERRDWNEAQSFVNLPQDVIQQAYMDAVVWSLRTLNEFSSEPDSKRPNGPKDARRVG